MSKNSIYALIMIMIITEKTLCFYFEMETILIECCANWETYSCLVLHDIQWKAKWTGYFVLNGGRLQFKCVQQI